MAELNVVVSTSMAGPSPFGVGVGEKCLARIRSVSPNIKVTDASAFLYEEQRNDFSHKAEFDAILKDARQHVAIQEH